MLKQGQRDMEGLCKAFLALAIERIHIWLQKIKKAPVEEPSKEN